jgi:hypothetical protein
MVVPTGAVVFGTVITSVSETGNDVVGAIVVGVDVCAVPESSPLVARKVAPPAAAATATNPPMMSPGERRRGPDAGAGGGT